MSEFRAVICAVSVVVVGMAVVNAWATTPAETQAAADGEVLRLREAAWRAWFGGDEAALRRILPADFIGISAKAGPMATLDVTIGQSREFHQGGGRLVSLKFAETRFQRYGDVVIIYGTYAAEIESGGKTQTSQGRLTEMFLKRGNAWVHTGWHLDGVTPAGQ